MTAFERADETDRQRVPRTLRSTGYLVAATLNGVFLWVAHHMVEWDWPRFITPAWDDVLPLVTASLLVSIVANLVYAVDDSAPVKSIGNILTSGVGFVVAVRMWQVFPFDFSTYAVDWSWLARLATGIAIVGSALGVIVETARLLRWPDSHDRRAQGTPPPSPAGRA